MLGSFLPISLYESSAYLFDMGSPSDEEDRRSDGGPVHHVTIANPFYMGKYEESTESFNDSVMSNFLADKEILRGECQFFERKNEYFWTVLVEYRLLAIAQREPLGKQKKGEMKATKGCSPRLIYRSSTHCANGGLSGAKKRGFHLTLSAPISSLRK